MDSWDKIQKNEYQKPTSGTGLKVLQKIELTKTKRIIEYYVHRDKN
jgi:hypothetical protein